VLAVVAAVAEEPDGIANAKTVLNAQNALVSANARDAVLVVALVDAVVVDAVVVVA
jgi:hypothetical protein